MLIRCNQGCKLQGGTTTGSVDLDTNEVVCDYCGDDIENMSSFAVKSLISQGKILKKEGTKAFQFECKTCNKVVETIVEGDNVVGRGCDGDCKFEISSFAIRAMKSIDNSGDID
jgi:hypothetical protein